jgi:hypothetical protein
MDREIDDPLGERMLAGDPFLNYCHWPYQPVPSAVPASERLRPSSLLLEVLRQMEGGGWLFATIRAIQQGVGTHRCVYGVKRIAEEWAIEIYVYDYRRRERVVSVDRFLRATGGRLRTAATVDEAIPYFMFSFDLDARLAAEQGMLEAVHLYIGNPRSDVSSGVAYRVDRQTTRLENFYFFFDARQDADGIEQKLLCSAFGPQDGSVDAIYRRALRDCDTICLANKPHSDTIYFSGITVDQLTDFLAWQQYPEPFVRFVSDHRDRLSHLRYDVGVDYRWQDGRPVWLKSGLYGVF